MKCTDDFINKNIIDRRGEKSKQKDITLDDLVEKYKNTRKVIETAKQVIKEYDKELHLKLLRRKDYERKLDNCILRVKFYVEKMKTEQIPKISFAEQLDLFNIISWLIEDDYTKEFEEQGIDLKEIKSFMMMTHYEMLHFKIAKDTLEEATEKQKELFDYVSFETFAFENIICHRRAKHFMIRLKDELKCVFCGASTKDYNLTVDQLDFLTDAARQKGELLVGATETDLPFIEVTVNEIKKEVDRKKEKEIEKERYKSISLDCEEDYEEDYEEELPDDSDFELQKRLNKAHELDSQSNRPESEISLNFEKIPQQEAEIKIALLDEEIARAEDDETIEKLLVQRCQYLMQSGADIPTMLNKANTRTDKIRAAKAYYNLTGNFLEDCSFNISSAYLKDEEKISRLLLENEEKLKNANNSQKQFESYLRRKYEILILTGAHIPTLFKRAITRTEKIGVVNAYYNLTSLNYRRQSGYFEDGILISDADRYECATADPEINNLILALKYPNR